jgi:hypothetical protein
MLARLYDASGMTASAADHYEAYADRAADGETRVAARARLAELRAQLAAEAAAPAPAEPAAAQAPAAPGATP